MHGPARNLTRMKTKASIAGHPLHPMLIGFPIALYPTALIFDLVWLWRADPIWMSAAFWTLSLAVLFTIIAIVPGLIDYFASVPEGDAKKTATRHMILGFVIVTLGIGGLALRWVSGAYTTGAAETVDAAAAPTGALTWAAIGINVVTSLLLIAQGWLGGDLVYNYGMGVNRRPRRDGTHEATATRGRVGGGKL